MTDEQKKSERQADALERYIDYKSFYYAVCDRANKIIEETGRVEGAHYAAMNLLLADLRKRAGLQEQSP